VGIGVEGGLNVTTANLFYVFFSFLRFNNNFTSAIDELDEALVRFLSAKDCFIHDFLD